MELYELVKVLHTELNLKLTKLEDTCKWLTEKKLIFQEFPELMALQTMDLYKTKENLKKLQFTVVGILLELAKNNEKSCKLAGKVISCPVFGEALVMKRHVHQYNKGTDDDGNVINFDLLDYSNEVYNIKSDDPKYEDEVTYNIKKTMECVGPLPNSKYEEF